MNNSTLIVNAQSATPALQEEPSPEATEEAKLLETVSQLPSAPLSGLEDNDPGSTLSLESSQQSATSAIMKALFQVRSVKKNYRGSEKPRIIVEGVTSKEVRSFRLTGSDGAVVEMESRLVEEDPPVFQIEPPASFKPGKYVLQATDSSGHTSEQDFTWGVLALNTNKSIYAPGENAKIAIAVLDERGEMVCNARVTLEVTDPKGNKEAVTTEEGKIVVNPECTEKKLTLTPDYETSYTTNGLGIYRMTLAAETGNGKYIINDLFEVRDDIAFDVERFGATRIYPPETYPVMLSFTAKEDFEGTVTEIVPTSFDIGKLDEAQGYESITPAPIEKKEDRILGASIFNLGLPYEEEQELTQGFGSVEIDPLMRKKYKEFGVLGHDGVDFGLPSGTPVISVDDGEVVRAQKNSDYGTTIVIKHKWGKSYYGHLSEMSVEEGDSVSKGDKIGLSGSTGLSSGPHLHFSIKPDKNDPDNGYFGKIDPSAFLGIDAPEVKGLSTDVALEVIPANAPESDLKIITWKVSAKKGEKVNIGYTFKAPNISPAFYLLGPAEFRNTTDELLFQEARQWQIAGDTTGGTTRLYLHSKDVSEENATYNSMLPSVLPEGDTEGSGTDNSTTNFTTPPCEAAGFDQDTTAAVNEESALAERCVATFYSPILGANIQMDTADTNSVSYSLYASEEGSCSTCVLTARLYEYVESGSTFNLIDTTSSAAVTNAAMTSITWNATPDTSTTVDAGNRLVVVFTMNTGAVPDTGGGTDTINVSFDRPATTPAYMSMSYTFTTADKPSLASSYDDDFDESGSCASSCDGTTILTTPTWTISTSGATTTESVQVHGGGTTGSTQWLTLTDVKTADLVPTSLANYTYIYQTPTIGDGDVSTQVASSHSRVPTTDPRDLAGLLLRFSSNTDFLILQSYYDGTNSVVEVNNSGTLTGTTATITGNANNILLKWSKTGTSYQAKYCASDLSDCTNSGNWTSLGTAITKSGSFDRAGLTTFVEYVSGTNTQYSASFEWFDSTITPPTFAQSAYRMFNNADSTNVGSVLAAQDTAATLGAAGDAFRLRTLLHVGVSELPVSGQNFKLQYAQRSGTCDTGFSGETYADISDGSGTSGPLSAGTGVSQSTGIAWTNVSNITSSNDLRASVALGDVQVSQQLKATDFGFSIPTGATVNGIVAEAEISATNVDDVYDNAIKIVKAGTVTGELRGDVDPWPTTETYKSWGGTTDLWGETWTPSDINNSGFGVMVDVFTQFGFASSSVASVDHIRLTVYYTEAGGTLKFQNNTTPADGVALTANGSDPTHSSDTIVPQTYEEGNSFTNSQAAIPAGQDGKWDFALKDDGAPASTTYCLRVVKSDGSQLDTYSVIPEITIAGGVAGPTVDQLMRHGKWFSGGVEQPFTF